MTAPTSTVSSTSKRTSIRVPATGDGISVSTLSVETSSSGSSTSTVSPTSFSQDVMVPSVTDSPSSGISTSEALPEPPDFFGFSDFFSSSAESSLASSTVSLSSLDSDSSMASSEGTSASSSSESSESSDAAASASPMRAMTAPTSTVSSTSARTSTRVPATGDGISVSTLSVETSSSGSSTSTVSPTSFSQVVMVPSVTDSPSSGISTSVALPEPPDFFGFSDLSSDFSSSAASSSAASSASSSSASSAESSEPESPDSSSSPILAMTSPTSTVSSSSARISSSTPATGDGISVSTLSVETSSKGSSTSTVSPTFFSQVVIVPSVTDSPSSGISTEVAMCALLDNRSIVGDHELGYRFANSPAYAACPTCRVAARRACAGVRFGLARGRRPGGAGAAALTGGGARLLCDARRHPRRPGSCFATPVATRAGRAVYSPARSSSAANMVRTGTPVARFGV